MRRLPHSPLFINAEYLLANLLIGLVTGVLHLLRDMLNVEIVIVLYLLLVVISTLLWGLGPHAHRVERRGCTNSTSR